MFLHGMKLKKKLAESVPSGPVIVDPLKNLTVSIDSYNVRRSVSIFFDDDGKKCWTKAWFNGREKGEPSVEITKQLAIAFINDTIGKDAWLSRFYPKQMSVCQKSEEQTRQQLLGLG